MSERAFKHPHSASDECTSACPAFDPMGWRCSACGRQRPMMADTEDWPAPLCFERFDDAFDSVARASRKGAST